MPSVVLVGLGLVELGLLPERVRALVRALARALVETEPEPEEELASTFSCLNCKGFCRPDSSPVLLLTLKTPSVSEASSSPDNFRNPRRLPERKRACA